MYWYVIYASALLTSPDANDAYKQNFSGMSEDQLAALPPELRTMAIAGSAAMMNGGGHGGMMPTGGMNMNGNPMMGQMMNMPMMNPAMMQEMGMAMSDMGMGMGGPGMQMGGGPGMQMGMMQGDGPGAQAGSAGQSAQDGGMGMGDGFVPGGGGPGQGQGQGMMGMGGDFNIQVRSLSCDAQCSYRVLTSATGPEHGAAAWPNVRWSGGRAH